MINQEIQNQITIKYTQNKSCNQIAKEYNISVTTVINILKCNNITIRPRSKHPLNYNYFDKIDEEHKSYWLGFLYADGNLNLKRNLIRIQLQEKDKEILEKFNNDLSTKKPLSFIECKSKYPTWQNQWLLSIYSSHMCEKLINLGCVPCKSLILKFPTENQVPSNLIKPFIRGMWDGDGSISLYYAKNGNKISPRLCGQIVSTLDVCKNIQKIFYNQLGVTSHIVNINKNTITKRLKISGTQQNYKIMTWLYENSTINLQRKYENFQQYKETMIKNGTKFNPIN